MTTGGNRGEWGEPYVALHLLGTGKIYIADEEGKKRSNEWMNVLEVIRQETLERLVMYRRDPETTMVNIYVDGKLVTSVPAARFLKASASLAAEILTSTTRTFTVSDDIMNFLHEIEMQHMKARSVEKSDIFLTINDPRAAVTRQNIGFSIKTKFGHNPTLFNTARASAVKYKLSHMNERVMMYANNLYDSKGHAAVTDRCNFLKNECDLEFVGFEKPKRSDIPVFEENLDMINPRLTTVIERMMWNHFFAGYSKNDIPDVVDRIIKDNPCDIRMPKDKYPVMVKSFLYAAYCGLTASTLWNGKGEVNGGFISVSGDGEVLAHYALESEGFKDYLYRNCYLEFPSTSEKHGDYGKIYEENGEYFFKLNFQVRYR